MSNRRRYNRKNTTLTTSIIYEFNQLKKFNFEAPYQRDFNVWDEQQKSFLIDSMMKNFPMPPIFLEQKVDQITKKTYYDVIDGKQRLTTIIDFIENKVKLPDTFGDDQYGAELLNSKTYKEISALEIESEDAKEFLSQFWTYSINVEYIENPDAKIVDNIFDRLNRGGERLNPQELRKANYYDSPIYQAINNVRKDQFISEMLLNLNKSRLEDVSFLTEIILLIQSSKIIDGVETQIDKNFKDLVEITEETGIEELMECFKGVLEIVKVFNINLDNYSIKGVSHLYALWFLAFYIYKNQIKIDETIVERLNSFYSDLRANREEEETKIYHATMQSSSKSRSSRKRRVKALLNYCGIETELKGY